MNGRGAELILQGPDRPTAILTALEALALADMTTLRFAVAYTTLGGCRELMPRLASRIGADRWDAVGKVVITSRDFGLTEPAAIEYLRSEHGVNVRFSTVPPSFHPKLYTFDALSGLSALVGSANLTRAALTTNTELATVVREIDMAPFAAHWHSLMDGSTPVDDELLEQYAATWERRPATVPPEPPPVRVPPSRTGALSVFPDAVVAGEVNPVAFEAFWVEAGSMSSGGSRTQLEAPRQAHRFFGFPSPAYDHEHKTLGAPVLVSADRVWDDRLLTWHGNNGMERINLPSVDKGGFDYPGTAILFRRVESGFQLAVAPWESEVAESWRVASRAGDHEYRLGSRGQRTCGLF